MGMTFLCKSKMLTFSAVMTSETMKNKGYHEGDKITLGFGLLKKKKTYVILEAANNFMAGLDTGDQTYVDV